LAATEHALEDLESEASSKFPVIGEDEVLQPGERVHHRSFGPGSIVSSNADNGTLEYRVKFDDPQRGTKLLVARYSPMIKL
jgi:hypothetical protein